MQPIRVVPRRVCFTQVTLRPRFPAIPHAAITLHTTTAGTAGIERVVLAHRGDAVLRWGVPRCLPRHLHSTDRTRPSEGERSATFVCNPWPPTPPQTRIAIPRKQSSPACRLRLSTPLHSPRLRRRGASRWPWRRRTSGALHPESAMPLRIASAASPRLACSTRCRASRGRCVGR